MGKAKKGGATLKRTVGTRSPKKRVVVICEGSKTEPMYLNLVNTTARDALVELIIVDEPATAPKQLVERACRERANAVALVKRTKDPNAEIDEIWCAFDVDEHPLLKEARQQATDNGINIAISNPSVEVWFLLHFVDHRAHIHRDNARRLLEGHISGYDKRLTSLEEMTGHYEVARSRAQKLAEKHKGDGTDFPHDNPSSDMWKLVDSLGAKY